MKHVARPVAPTKRAAKPKPPAAAPAPAGTNQLVIRDPAAIAMVVEYAELQNKQKVIKDRMELLNPTLKAMLGDAPMAYAGAHVLTLVQVPAIPPTANRLIDKSMIGMVMLGTKGRVAYSQLTVK